MSFTFKKINDTVKNAFTLIELLVVLVVISILVGITIPVSKYVSQRINQAQYEAQTAKIKAALEDYRAKYGEYPITPTYEYFNPVSGHVETNYNTLQEVENHYPSNILTECYWTSTNDPLSPYTNVNLTTNTCEIMGPPLNITNDYSLTYPLMLRQLDAGEQAYMEFPHKTLAYYVWKDAAGNIKWQGEWSKTVYRRTAGGTPVPITLLGRKGMPINRLRAEDPRYGKQIKYTSDGTSYALTNWGF